MVSWAEPGCTVPLPLEEWSHVPMGPGKHEELLPQKPSAVPSTPPREAYLLHPDLQRTWRWAAVLERGPAAWQWLWAWPSGAGVCWGKPRCGPRASGRTARAETTWTPERGQEDTSTAETRQAWPLGRAPGIQGCPAGSGVPTPWVQFKEGWGDF